MSTTTKKKSRKSGGVKPGKRATRAIGAARQQREAAAKTERLRQQAIKDIAAMGTSDDAAATSPATAPPTTAPTTVPTKAPSAKGGAKATKGGASGTDATRAAVPAKGGKRAAKAKPAKEPKPKRVSLLDAAAMHLATAKEPMKCVDMVTAVEAHGLWKRGGGKTPHATLYAAIIREIAAKGREARFKKTERGTFASTPTAGKGA